MNHSLATKIETVAVAPPLEALRESSSLLAFSIQEVETTGQTVCLNITRQDHMARGRTATNFEPAVTLRIKHWLEVDGRFAIGDGGVELLRAIAAHGTLAKAAREVGSSYRHAWGYVRQAESALGIPLTQSRPGKGTARGLELTAQARRLLRQFPSGAKSRRFPKLS